MTRARDLADSADKDIAGTLTLDAVNASGVITGLTVEATGDTAAGDNAAMGYTAAEGLILTGQGSTGDITIKNDADAVVLQVPTGTTNVNVIGSIDVATNAVIDGTGLVTGVLTTTAATVFNGGFAANAGSTITRNDNGVQLTLISTDADANQGPELRLYRNSASPADDDILGRIKWTGEDSAGNESTFGLIQVIATDITNGAEDAQMKFSPVLADAFPDALILTGAGATFNSTISSSDISVNSGGAISAINVSGSGRADLFLIDSGAGTDAKRRTIRSDGGTLTFGMENDAVDAFTSHMTISGAGAVTMPLQPAFFATPNTNQNNIANNNSSVHVLLQTEIFDNNSDFASSTFTAPVTGKYMLSYSLCLLNMDSAADYYIPQIKTSNRDINSLYDPGQLNGDPAYQTFTMSVLTDMDAGDTSTVRIIQNGGTAQTDVEASSLRTYFSGYLVA